LGDLFCLLHRLCEAHSAAAIRLASFTLDCFGSLAMTKALFLALLLALAACDKRPPAPTAEQNAQLNEAEAMLNEEGAASENAAPSDLD
jgi:hypothetical protein